MNMRKNSIWKVFCIFFLVSAAGCGAVLTAEADRNVYDAPLGSNDITKRAFEDDKFIVEMANRYGLMALFAETVYRAELDEAVRDQLGCMYLVPGWQGNAQFGMPKVAGAVSGWERWIPTDSGEAPCLNDQSGLFYETYVNRDANGAIREAVIAFRGTENRPGQVRSDWTSNLAAAFGFEPAQYKVARDHVPGVILRLIKAAGGSDKIKIYAVGHSLGGGLAQQAGYLSNDILEVFTFNTTPVTNWTYLRHIGLVRQGYPIIHRIYHGGEALETPRFIATTATKARYGRHDIGIQFDNRSYIKGHSMKILACNFGIILSKTQTGNGSHDYPNEYIFNHVLKATGGTQAQRASESNPRICDDDLPGKGHKE